MSFYAVIPARATTHTFSGTLNYRVLDGSANGKYYDITPNRGLAISGTVGGLECFSSSQHINPTYITCMEGKSGGRGTILCEAIVKVGIYEEEEFYAQSVKNPQTSQCYMYTYKIEDDGYDLQISGSITQ